MDCPDCMFGDHAHHNEEWDVKAGLIGGATCRCVGDCAERSRKAFAARIWPETAVDRLEAYLQGHRDACKDDRCTLLPGDGIPSYRQGWEDGAVVAGIELAAFRAGLEKLCDSLPEDEATKGRDFGRGVAHAVKSFRLLLDGG